MASIPILSRLSRRDYESLIATFLFFFAELLARIVFTLLPGFVVDGLETLLKSFFPWLYRSGRHPHFSQLEEATNMDDLVKCWGYPLETHLVRTLDSYLLTAFRIPHGREDESALLSPTRPITSLIPSTATTLHSSSSSSSSLNNKHVYTGKPVVLLNHGFMMCSEVWVCNISEHANLPLVLASAGYDVWMGNARGNKYSQKHLWKNPSDVSFWDFSMDELALYDLPDTVDYILNLTGAPTLTYIGFSQGTAQAFAALSINHRLNKQMNLFVALAPATTPEGLHNPMIDAIVKATPNVLYLILGRRAPLTMTFFWQQMLDAGLFMRVIDVACEFLFGWHNKNMTDHQKLISYQHLYSLTSVKTLVHWFQIIRIGTFQMYDEQPSRIPYKREQGPSHVPPLFPTRQIQTPIALFYGGSDSLVKFDVLTRNLPPIVYSKEEPSWEHLDFLWATGIERIVYPDVLALLKEYNPSSYQPSPSRHHHQHQQKRLQLKPGHVVLESQSSESEEKEGYSIEELEVQGDDDD